MRRFFLLILVLISFTIFGSSISYAVDTACYCSAGWPESNGCISQTWDPIAEEWVCGGSDLDSACCAECEATYGYSQCDEDGGCFLPGTLVKSRNGFSKIEDIKVGDEVTSFEDGKITQSKVSQIYERQRDFYYSLVAGDYKVKASAEHPFYVGNGKYKEISELKKGDTVYVLENNVLIPKKVTSNIRINQSTPVYNLTVDNTHTFFANDFAVHNKSDCPTILRNYPWPTITRGETDTTTARISWELTPAGSAPNRTLSIIMALESAGSRPFTRKCADEWADDCIVNEQNIDPHVTDHIDVTGLSPGKIYVMEAKYYPIALVCGGKDTNYLSSCTMTPDPLYISTPGQTGVLTTGLNLDGNQKVSVRYESLSPAVATVTNINIPLLQWAQSHTTTATGISNGLATVTNEAKYLVNVESLTWDVLCNDEAIVNVGPTSTPTPTATPTPTPTSAPNQWIKLKNTSFISSNSLTSSIPAVPVSYDSDDSPANTYFIRDTAGLVAAPGIINLGSSGTAGSPEYKASYTTTYKLQPATFLSYIKARKQHKVISNLNEINADGIYIYERDISIDSNSAPFNTTHDIVLISTGTVTVTRIAPDVTFAPGGSIAIIAPIINFSANITQANGIFIANNITTGSPANQGLKIVGNLIAQESLTNDREWTNPNRPSLFVVFDQQKYIDLLPYLSTANYDWRQIQ